MEKPPRTSVQEVAADEPGVRIFMVTSEERAGYETAQRLKVKQFPKRHTSTLPRRTTSKYSIHKYSIHLDEPLAAAIIAAGRNCIGLDWHGGENQA
jgi:hypothetical protein